MIERNSQCPPPAADQMEAALERWEAEGGALKATSARPDARPSRQDATGSEAP
jgi:hypothetical protein